MLLLCHFLPGTIHSKRMVTSLQSLSAFLHNIVMLTMDGCHPFSLAGRQG